MSAEFQNHLAAQGYQTDSPIILDGKLRRVRWIADGERRGDPTGWYVGHTHGTLEFVAWGDWRDGINERWSNRAERKWSLAERAEFKARQAEAAEKAAQERLLQAGKASARAARLLVRSEMADGMPSLPAYCVRKKIPGTRLRSLLGRVLVPLHDEERRLVNIQIIEPDGTKRFLKSAALVGAAWMTGPMPPTGWNGSIAVAEGVATAATVRELSGLTVFAAMTAGNLEAVTESLRRRWPAASIIIAADDDRWEKNGDPRQSEKNAGQKKAQQAAEKHGALVVTPTFTNATSRGTDWNDLAMEEGEEQAAAKWGKAVNLAKLDRQLQVMPDGDYQCRKESLLAAYRTAGLGKIGVRQLDARRKLLRGGADGGKPETDESPAGVLVKILTDVELWKDQFGTAFATIENQFGVTIHTKIEGQTFEDWLRMQFDAETHGAIPPREIVASVIKQVAARARIFGETHQTEIRWAHADGVLWLDLGRPDGHAIRITSDGWEEVEKVSGARFVRPGDFGRLPSPERGGTMEDLWGVLNVAPEDHVLVAGWLIAAALFPVAPPFLLNICGAQGTAKSSTSRIIRSCWDPSVANGQSLSDHNLPSLSLTCATQAVLMVENASYLSEEAQDALCRIITGEAEIDRKLYTNEELVKRAFRRPIIINGINSVATRADLAERAIIISLPEVTEEMRLTEEEIREKMCAAHPRIMAALLDALAYAMKSRPQIRQQMRAAKISHRMADSVEWITAAEEAMGFPFGSFIAAITHRQANTGEDALDGHPCLQVILDLLDENSRGFCRISMSEMAGKVVATDAHRTQKGVPTTARMLANWFQREKKRLKDSYGIDVGEARRANGVRFREIRRLPATNEEEQSEYTPFDD